MGPQSYGWRPAESKPSPEKEARPKLHENSKNPNIGYVESTQVTRLSPPGEGGGFLEMAPLEHTENHSSSDSITDSVQVVDRNGDLLNEDPDKPLHQTPGADIQSGEDRQTLDLEEAADERVKDNSPLTSELPEEDFQAISVIDTEGKLDTAKQNEAHVQMEQEFLPKPTPDMTVAGRGRAEYLCMAVSRDLGVSAPEKELYSLEPQAPTASSNTKPQGALLEGRNESYTDTKVSRDIRDGICTAIGFENVLENQHNIFPKPKDATTASPIPSKSQDYEHPDQLALTPINTAIILGSSSQQFGMPPILSSSPPGKDAPNSIVAEDLLSDGSSSSADETPQYDKSSIAVQDIRNEEQLYITTSLGPNQERLAGAFSFIGNGATRSHIEDRPQHEAIASIEKQTTKPIGVAADRKLSSGAEAIQIEKPSLETDPSENQQLEKEIATKPDVQSSTEYNVGPSSLAPSPVKHRISNMEFPRTDALDLLWPSSAGFQRSFGIDNRELHTLQAKEAYHEYRNNPLDDYDNPNFIATRIGPVQRFTDESPQRNTKLDDEIPSRHEITPPQRDSEALLVTVPTKPEIEIIDLESENESEYYGVPVSQLAKDAGSTPIEIENSGDEPSEDGQTRKAGDSEPRLRHIPCLVNKKGDANDTIGANVIVPIINNNNEKVDHRVQLHMEQSSITLSNPSGSRQSPAVEQFLAKGEPSLQDLDSGSGGLPWSFISALDQKMPKNSANLISETQLFTPAASQPQRGFALDLSAAIVQADNGLLTPSMTQTSAVPLMRPNTPKEQPTPSLSKQSSLIPEESISDIVQEYNLDTHSSPPTKISTTPPLRPATPDQKYLVVEKLEATRSRSTKRALEFKSMDRASSASTWFTPKDTSQLTHVSDSEGEIENVYSSDQVSPIGEASLPPVPSSPAPTQYRNTSEPSPSGLRTALSYYAPLATLLSHFNNLTSVLATVHSFTPIKRSISGPRDYYQTLYLTDPSSVSRPLSLAQVFRPDEIAFPNVIQGDAILLRNFKVQSFQNRVGLLSTHSSAWAVFRQDTEVQVRGPPVEFGPEERSFARGLWNWWASVRIEHGKSEILQMPIVFIEDKEEEARKIFKDKRKWKLHIVPKSIASTPNAIKIYTRKPSVGPSPKPPAKDGGKDQETPTRNRKGSTSTQGTNSSPASDWHMLGDGTWHEPSPGPEVPDHERGHTPTRTPIKRRRKINAIKASHSSPRADRHVLRDGTSYESTPEKTVRRPGVNYHELRDGTTYVDDDGSGDRA